MLAINHCLIEARRLDTGHYNNFLIDMDHCCETDIENTVIFLQRSGALKFIWTNYLKKDDFIFAASERKQIDVQGCLRGKQIIRPFWMWSLNESIVLCPADI